MPATDHAPARLAALPAGAALAVVLLWSGKGGGYAPGVWLPSALVVLALGAFAVAARPRGAPVARPPALAAALLAAFALWNAASIVWAGDRGTAWSGANKTLLYAALFALVATSQLSVPAVRLLGAGYAAGVAAVGIVTVERIVHAAHPGSFFLFGRLSAPTGYPNGTAALFMLPVFLLLHEGSRRDGRPTARAAALALAGVLADLALLPQSRGMLYSTAVAVPLFVALSPTRLRAGAAACTVAAAVWIFRGPVLAVFGTPVDGARLDHALVAARTAMLLTALALVVAGAAWSAADRRLRPSPRAVRAASLAAAAIAGAAILAAAGVAADRHGGPTAAARDAWGSFRAGEPGGGSRFTGLGSNRYDFWRVSLHVFARHPLGGAGSDNFAIEYLRLRRSGEQPLYPHSLVFRLLEQTGIVGAALFAAALGAAVAAALRRRSAEVRALAAALVACFGYWLVHASVDWLWEIPALAGGAFALLGLAIAAGREALAPTSSRLPRAGTLAAAAAVGLACAASFALPWIAGRETDAAAAGFRAAPARAFDRIASARTLNPLSDEPDLVGALIALRLREYGRMRNELERALDRNPHGWYAHVQLAAADSMLGRRGEALAVARAARALDPLGEIPARAVRRLEAGRRLEPEQVEAWVAAQARGLH